MNSAMANNDGRRADDGYSVRRWLEVVSRLLESELHIYIIIYVYVYVMINFINVYNMSCYMYMYDSILNITILAYI